MAKNGKQLGIENLNRLKDYLSGLEAKGEKVPMSGERPNVSAIALGCGFDRQVLYKNPACRNLMEDAVRKIGGASIATVKNVKSHDPKAQRIRELEKRLADLQEKLEASEAAVRELRPYKRLYDAAIETGRDLF